MKDSDVLDFLRAARPQFLSGEDISRKLKVSRSAVWKEIQHLRELGYRIDAEPHLGYRLVSIPDRMFADELRHGLKTRWLGGKILSYESLDSTNDSVYRLGEHAEKEGLCIFAEYQKKGRGRLGRAWVSPKHKAILFSVLLRPELSPGEISKITLTAAVSVVRAVQKVTGRCLEIKWPNDIVFHGKKIGGILTEMSAEADRVKFVVLGIGLNVNACLADLPAEASSLKEILGMELPRLELAQSLLQELERDMNLLKKGRFKEIAKEWEEFSVTMGRRVAATLADRKIHGMATGIDATGALWIRKDNGLQERVLSGDIQHIR